MLMPVVCSPCACTGSGMRGGDSKMPVPVGVGMLSSLLSIAATVRIPQAHPDTGGL